MIRGRLVSRARSGRRLIVRSTRIVSGSGPILELLTVPFLAVVLIGLLTPNGMASSGDPYVYLDRAVAVLRGLVPFRDFSSEYPPLALIPMTAPHLWPDVDRGGYFTLVIVENGVLASAIAVTLLWLARRSWSPAGAARALATWAVLILLLASVAAWRFDLAAVLLTMLAVMAAAAERPGLAGVILGLGALTKIFPLVLVPILALRCLAERDVRGAARLVIGAVIAIALVMAPFLVAAGPNALSFVGYQFARGLQVESLGGGLVFLAHTLGLVGATTGFSHYSFEAASPVSSVVISTLTPLMLGLYAVIFVAALLRFRQERDRLGHVQNGTVVVYLVAAILVLVLTNKVFSPQYLLWLLPFGALLPRPQAWLLMLACFLTFAVFPLNYQALLDMRPEVIAVLNVRNLLLVMLLAWLLLGYKPTLRRGRRVEGATGETPAPTTEADHVPGRGPEDARPSPGAALEAAATPKG